MKLDSYHKIITDVNVTLLQASLMLFSYHENGAILTFSNIAVNVVNFTKHLDIKYYKYVFVFKHRHTNGSNISKLKPAN